MDSSMRTTPTETVGRPTPTLSGEDSFDIEQSIVNDWSTMEDSEFAEFVRARKVVELETMLSGFQRTRMEHMRRAEVASKLEDFTRSLIRDAATYDQSDGVGPRPGR